MGLILLVLATVKYILIYFIDYFYVKSDYNCFSAADGGMTTQSSSTGATPTPPAVIGGAPHRPRTTTPVETQSQPSMDTSYLYSEVNLSPNSCFESFINVGMPPVGLYYNILLICYKWDSAKQSSITTMKF